MTDGACDIEGPAPEVCGLDDCVTVRSVFHGFEGFLESGDFSDVVVVVGDEPKEWRLHSLLLSMQSQFFQTALTGSFKESHQRHVHVQCQASAAAAWPALVQFFYTASIRIDAGSVLPLMALARLLMVPFVDAACLEFVKARLCHASCLGYLKQAVQHDLHDLQHECTTLAAKGLCFLYNGDVAGLPPHTVLEILQHEDLMVQCEVQVAEFVLKYLGSTQVDEETTRSICSQIRFTYLDNDTLTALASQGVVPRDMILEGALARMAVVDKQDLDLMSMEPPPRLSYSCNVRYNLPGGSTVMDVELDSIWEQLVQVMAVRVSSVREGCSRNVLSLEQDAWFETQCSSDPPSWVEISMPPNVTVMVLHRYTYAHGHRRSGYYRLRNFKTQVAERQGSTWVDVQARNLVDQNEAVVLSTWALTTQPAGCPGCSNTVQGSPGSTGQSLQGFQALRILATGAQEDGVYRLCIRNLKLFGVARVDLMAQAPGSSFVLQPHAFAPAHSSGIARLHHRHGSTSSRPGGTPDRRGSTSEVPGVAGFAQGQPEQPQNVQDHVE